MKKLGLLLLVQIVCLVKRFHYIWIYLKCLIISFFDGNREEVAQKLNVFNFAICIIFLLQRKCTFEIGLIHDKQIHSDNFKWNYFVTSFQKLEKSNGIHVSAGLLLDQSVLQLVRVIPYFIFNYLADLSCFIQDTTQKESFSLCAAWVLPWFTAPAKRGWLKLLLGVVWLHHFRQQNFMISLIGYLNEDSLFLITFELDDDVQQQIFFCVFVWILDI